MPTVTGTPQAFAFTTSGTTVTYTGGGTTGSTTWDVLCVNSDNVVTTPAGWTSAANRVNSQGSYIFIRNGGVTSAALALGGGINSNSSALWVRITNATALDTGAVGTAGVDGASGTATPAFTSGALSTAANMAIAFAALHGVGTAVPTTYTWSAGYTGQVQGAQGGVAGSAVAGSVAIKTPAGTAAESPSVSWTLGTASDRYTLFVAFTDAGGGATPISVADGGSAADTLAAAATIALADAGSAVDTLAVSRALDLADAGSAADTVATTAVVPLADTGTGAQAITLATIAAALADAGSAADTVVVAAVFPMADAGTAADTAAASIAVALGQAGSAADTITAAASVGLADTAAAADALAVMAAVPLADGGSETDALDNGLGTNKNLTDGGSATEAITATVVVALTDSGAAADTIAVAAAVPIADAGSGADALAVGTTKNLADTGAGADSLSVTVSLSLVDAGSSGQTLTAAVTLSLTDSGSAADTATGNDDANVLKAFGDAGAGSDVLTFVHSLITGQPVVTGTALTAGVTGDPLAASVAGDPQTAGVT